MEMVQAADENIKRNIESVDSVALLQRLQAVQLNQYRYTADWQQVRGLSSADYGVSRKVRGLVAQQVSEAFPEYVHIEQEMSIPEKGIPMS
jgi:hypothetical protein